MTLCSAARHKSASDHQLSMLRTLVCTHTEQACVAYVRLTLKLLRLLQHCALVQQSVWSKPFSDIGVLRSNHPHNSSNTAAPLYICVSFHIV